jgi:purine-nucleoside phosphorylase
MEDKDFLFENHVAQVLEAEKWFRKHIEPVPELAIITGSAGPKSLLDHFYTGDSFDGRTWTDHSFPKTLAKPAAKGHESKMRIGEINGLRVLLVMGRSHFYERPTDPYRHTAMVRALGRFGVKNLILTNAAGALNSKYAPGDLCIISDVDPSYMGHTPLGGDKEQMEKYFGPQFTALNPGLDHRFQELASMVSYLGGALHIDATYTATAGGYYETALQARNLPQSIDLAGMSSIPELMVARQLGMRVAMFSIVTNMVAKDIIRPDQAVDHEKVGQEAQ